jgi:hypothetical protein
LRTRFTNAPIASAPTSSELARLPAVQVLERWGVVPLFATVVGGITGMAVVYATVVLRHRDHELPVPEAKRA